MHTDPATILLSMFLGVYVAFLGWIFWEKILKELLNK